VLHTCQQQEAAAARLETRVDECLAAFEAWQTLAAMRAEQAQRAT